MAWWHQAISNHLVQSCPRFIVPGSCVTRPQWVKVCACHSVWETKFFEHSPKNLCPLLRDHLVKGALKSNTPKTTPYPQQFCKKQDCQTCKLIKRRDKLPQNNREYKLAKDVNCQTNNVVYLLECTRCKKQYVGETKRNFLTRFKEHLADIRHNTGLDIYFFPNLAVGQPSNNMDLSEIEIRLGRIIIISFWHLK